jgi:hypothetical protein
MCEQSWDGLEIVVEATEIDHLVRLEVPSETWSKHTILKSQHFKGGEVERIGKAEREVEERWLFMKLKHLRFKEVVKWSHSAERSSCTLDLAMMGHTICPQA